MKTKNRKKVKRTDKQFAIEGQLLVSVFYFHFQFVCFLVFILSGYIHIVGWQVWTGQQKSGWNWKEPGHWAAKVQFK